MIFTILKVIGIILLVVLALILTALLCVLFVPVKYRAVGSFDNTDIRAKAHASWLFHLFALHIEYADETDGYIRLAFVKRKLFDNALTAEGKTPVAWCFSTMPSENWKNGVGSALTAYAAGTGDWNAVVTAFVDGWKTEAALNAG